jgi:hypothetical protein
MLTMRGEATAREDRVIRDAWVRKLVNGKSMVTPLKTQRLENFPGAPDELRKNDKMQRMAYEG